MHELARRPLRPSLVVAAVAVFTATGAVTAGCSSRSNQYVNCVDEQGRVVDPDYCDDDGDGYHSSHYGHYYYYPSRRKYRVGSKAPSSWRKGSISPSDSAARSRAGLPSSGRIGGTSVRSGGFGKSSGKSGTSGHGTSGHGSSGHGGGS